MTFYHGIRITDGGTLGTQISLGGSTYPVFVGTAFGPTTTGSAPVTPKKINNFQEYLDTYGWGNRDDGDPDPSAVEHDFTLDEVAWLFFKLYKIGPIICINVYNATDHPGGVADVESADINAGLELVEGAMTELQFIPSHLCAPRYSQAAAVKAVLHTMNTIGGFAVMVFEDLLDDPEDDDDEAKDAAIVEAAAITTPNVMMFWPERGGFPLSSIACAIAEWVTITKYAGIPMGSPSNKEILVDFETGDRIVLAAWLDALNEGKVVTWKQIRSQCNLWGTWLAPYDGDGGTVDYVNDTYIPRRLRNYIEERVKTEFHANVDDPTNLRLIEDVVAKLNDFGGTLIGRGAALGFRCDFFSEKNPLANLIAGTVTFTITMLSPREASDINFDVITDLTYYDTLFG
jgi:hypothetical protein